MSYYAPETFRGGRGRGGRRGSNFVRGRGREIFQGSRDRGQYDKERPAKRHHHQEERGYHHRNEDEEYRYRKSNKKFRNNEWKESDRREERNRSRRESPEQCYSISSGSDSDSRNGRKSSVEDFAKEEEEKPVIRDKRTDADHDSDDCSKAEELAQNTHNILMTLGWLPQSISEISSNQSDEAVKREPSEERWNSYQSRTLPFSGGQATNIHHQERFDDDEDDKKWHQFSMTTPSESDRHAKEKSRPVADSTVTDILKTLGFGSNAFAETPSEPEPPTFKSNFYSVDSCTLGPPGGSAAAAKESLQFRRETATRREYGQANIENKNLYEKFTDSDIDEAISKVDKDTTRRPGFVAMEVKKEDVDEDDVRDDIGFSRKGQPRQKDRAPSLPRRDVTRFDNRNLVFENKTIKLKEENLDEDEDDIRCKSPLRGDSNFKKTINQNKVKQTVAEPPPVVKQAKNREPSLRKTSRAHDASPKNKSDNFRHKYDNHKRDDSRVQKPVASGSSGSGGTFASKEDRSRRRSSSSGGGKFSRSHLRKRRDSSDSRSPEKRKKRSRVASPQKSKHRGTTLAAEKSAIAKPAEAPKSRTPEKPKKSKVGFDYFDEGSHWCEECNMIFEEATDYLNHLHSQSHQQVVKNNIKPWAATSGKDKEPSLSSRNRLSIPLKGIEFMMATPAFYCKLCSELIADLKLADKHILSEEHNSKYRIYSDAHPGYQMKKSLDKQQKMMLATRVLSQSESTAFSSATTADPKPPENKTDAVDDIVEQMKKDERLGKNKPEKAVPQKEGAATAVVTSKSSVTSQENLSPSKQFSKSSNPVATFAQVKAVAAGINASVSGPQAKKLPFIGKRPQSKPVSLKSDADVAKSQSNSASLSRDELLSRVMIDTIPKKGSISVEGQIFNTRMVTPFPPAPPPFPNFGLPLRGPFYGSSRQPSVPLYYDSSTGGYFAYDPKTQNIVGQDESTVGVVAQDPTVLTSGNDQRANQFVSQVKPDDNTIREHEPICDVVDMEESSPEHQSDQDDLDSYKGQYESTRGIDRDEASRNRPSAVKLICNLGQSEMTSRIIGPDQMNQNMTTDLNEPTCNDFPDRATSVVTKSNKTISNIENLDKSDNENNSSCKQTDEIIDPDGSVVNDEVDDYNICTTKPAQDVSCQNDPARDVIGQEEPLRDVSCEDEPTQAISCEDKPTQAMSWEDEPTQAMSCEDELTQVMSCEDKPTQAMSCEGEPTQAMSCEDEPTQAMSCEDELTQAISCEDKPIQAISCQNEPTSDISCRNEPTPDISCQNEQTQDMSCQDKLTQSISRQDEPASDIGCQDEPAKDIISQDEPVRDISCQDGLTGNMANQSESAESLITLDELMSNVASQPTSDSAGTKTSISSADLNDLSVDEVIPMEFAHIANLVEPIDDGIIVQSDAAGFPSPVSCNVDPASVAVSPCRMEGSIDRKELPSVGIFEQEDPTDLIFSDRSCDEIIDEDESSANVVIDIQNESSEAGTVAAVDLFANDETGTPEMEDEKSESCGPTAETFDFQKSEVNSEIVNSAVATHGRERCSAEDESQQILSQKEVRVEIDYEIPSLQDESEPVEINIPAEINNKSQQTILQVKDLSLDRSNTTSSDQGPEEDILLDCLSTTEEPNFGEVKEVSAAQAAFMSDCATSVEVLDWNRTAELSQDSISLSFVDVCAVDSASGGAASNYVDIFSTITSFHEGANFTTPANVDPTGNEDISDVSVSVDSSISTAAATVGDSVEDTCDVDSCQSSTTEIASEEEEGAAEWR